AISQKMTMADITAALQRVSGLRRGGPAMRLTPWWLLLSAVLWVSSVRMVPAGDNVWTSIGPAGGSVLALALDPGMPTTLYAGTGGSGVFKSRDGGTTWQASNTGGLSDASVRALALDPTTPTTLYAGTEGSGVFKSTDGGTSWSTVLASTYVN